MVHNRRPIWVARIPTKPSMRASSGMMARVSATTCAASASERTSIQVTLNAPSRASFPDAMSTLEPKDTGAHLVRLDHDLQAELLDEPSPVEVALDGCDVTVPYPDEVDARNAIVRPVAGPPPNGPVLVPRMIHRAVTESASATGAAASSKERSGKAVNVATRNPASC